MNNKTKYNPNIHHRKSIRLKGYDYAQAGLYFITICCQNRACLFGEVVNKEMKLNDAGTMVENEWLKLPNRFQNIQLHEYVVMPNHFHAILEIVGATLVVAQNDAGNQNNTSIQNGQPQGFAHPVNTSNDDDSKMGQPQGFSHPVNTSNDDDSKMGQPQGFAQTVNTSNNDDSKMGQPQGFAHPVNTSNDDDSKMGQPQGIAPTGKTVGNMIGAFQSIVTVEYIRGVKTLNWQPFDGKLWQRNYYEHIIRNEQSYLTISNYIKNNPAKWGDDKFYKK